MPPWSAIDTFMFDMDGTLLDLHFDNYFWLTLVPRIYSETHGVDREAAREIIKCKYEEVHGTLDWYCLDYWEKELQLDITTLKTTLKHKINVRPNVEKFLRELQHTNKRILLITNAHPASLDIKMRHTGIGEYFHQLISAHRLNLAKENHGFWERLQQLENYDPQRTLLFDDSLSVLRQARKEGIKYLYAIKQPDSQKPFLDPAEFPQVEDFDQLLPLQATMR
ncbi:MAG TPA: GMP/IMP nucleotidase [Gammaproteobacteria bacterium]|jgi:putative hydrolase of the HAD superfamily|nr:hypothetical protein [Gammaproteobacteria bacterium]HAT26800.1 GMP/IMP nucleotidase [Gammaproteobacteria bacterium]|tara:strand:- start:6123 stop:6791 length:669 start_codon:yes stop_codon:yes gene_type:complete